MAGTPILQNPQVAMRTTAQYPEIKFSLHGRTRLSQRGITEEAVLQVIRFGEIIHKQGLKFHYLPKSKGKALGKKELEATRDLLVITNRSRTEVITCYKHPKAVHEVKKKPKRLSK
ncbi:hypothetical protein C943_04148 [Mariniradius saccharolyticus AK6]|uniref:DUF4258 domain-containing protein n=2 Tax=Mariniradius TaxID=1245590 RepID=M7XG72_9BACT|nr:hypothetical protein C943_04148 [Mariniradius saccharolyticus AK6]